MIFVHPNNIYPYLFHAYIYIYVYIIIEYKSLLHSGLEKSKSLKKMKKKLTKFANKISIDPLLSISIPFLSTSQASN
ncbi:hypothetical protein RCL_jg21170.t1 [Rhizophagus clarus]|uniref:Uncharacterized protein n=1 Tax=Rhizophagus clarus TaxID=94130 RepID=A0A8H3LYA0_9GLOM|nr:hypothetical protein RCL_jg21170.t1 [Rhizophagus clarus]